MKFLVVVRLGFKREYRLLVNVEDLNDLDCRLWIDDSGEQGRSCLDRVGAEEVAVEKQDEDEEENAALAELMTSFLLDDVNLCFEIAFNDILEELSELGW